MLRIEDPQVVSIMQEKDTKYDVAVIGAGPAGMIAALVAAETGLNVVLIEKNATAGKKLLLTGNGRCNLTNAEFNLKELVKNYNNGEFLFHVFSVFGPKEVVSFFEKLGVKTKIEAGKRVFPISNDAEEVLDALEKYLKENKVETIFNSEIIDIKKTGGKITKIILKDKEIFAKKYILATGGKSYPQTGSNGLGYKLAEKLGHTIVNPRPALTSIKIKDERVKSLQGISLKDVKINVFSRPSGIPSLAGQNNWKKKISEEGEILFTHFGITGPIVLNISADVEDLLQNGDPSKDSGQDTKIQIDFFPLLNIREVLKEFEDLLKRFTKKSIKNILSEFLPQRLSEVFLDTLKIDKEK